VAGVKDPGDDEVERPADVERRLTLMWAMLGEFPAAGLALRSTLDAWDHDRSRCATPLTQREPTSRWGRRLR